MLISWNGETIPALALEEELQVISDAGFGAMEIFIPKLNDYLKENSIESLAVKLKNHKIQPLTMNGIENINLQTAAEFSVVKDDCRSLAEACRVLDCPFIVVVPSPKPAEMSWPEIKAQTAAALRELAQLAAPYGVKLAFEFLAPANCSVRTLAQACEVIEAAGQENVGLVFDTYHFYVGGSSWESLETFDIDRLYIVHINDAENMPLDQLTDGNRVLPGEGIFPLERMLGRLVSRGFKGGYSLEVMRPSYRLREPKEYTRAAFIASENALIRASVK